MKFILVNAVSLTCVGVAGYLLMNNREGWGWFLFVGAICYTTLTSTRSVDKDEDDSSGYIPFLVTLLNGAPLSESGAPCSPL